MFKKFFYYLNIIIDKLIYSNFPYLKYLKDKKSSLTKVYTLYNFWGGSNDEQSWFVRYIESNSLNLNRNKIDLFSVFGPRKVLKYSNNKKIFFTGEHIGKDQFYDYNDYCLNEVNLSLGFREYDCISNYHRFPLWITYLLNPSDTTKDTIRLLLKNLEDNRVKAMGATGFCSLISRHDDKNDTRGNTYNRLSKFGKIYCPGRFMNNDKTPIPKYDDKINYLQGFKFNICPENHSSRGYVTEKLFDTFKAGIIPIYKGIFGELEEKIINKNRIVWIDEGLEKNIGNLISNKKNFENFVKQPIFNEKSDIYLYQFIQEFKNTLEKNI